MARNRSGYPPDGEQLDAIRFAWSCEKSAMMHDQWRGQVVRHSWTAVSRAVMESIGLLGGGLCGPPPSNLPRYALTNRTIVERRY